MSPLKTHLQSQNKKTTNTLSDQKEIPIRSTHHAGACIALPGTDLHQTSSEPASTHHARCPRSSKTFQISTSGTARHKIPSPPRSRVAHTSLHTPTLIGACSARPNNPRESSSQKRDGIMLPSHGSVVHPQTRHHSPESTVPHEPTVAVHL